MTPAEILSGMADLLRDMESRTECVGLEDERSAPGGCTCRGCRTCRALLAAADLLDAEEDAAGAEPLVIEQVPGGRVQVALLMSGPHDPAELARRLRATARALEGAA